MKKALITMALIALSAPAQAQYFGDAYLYYSVGGAAISSPATSTKIRFGSGSRSGFACGNFDPKIDITGILGSLGNTMPTLQSLAPALIGAMPGNILCRALPSLCQLMQHYTVRSEDAWRFSIDSCEAMQTAAIGEENPVSGWQTYGRAQEWARQEQSGVDATTAHRRVAETEDPCVTWVEGNLAGCPGNPPIRPVHDAARAGWCAMHGMPADCNERTSQETPASVTWPGPDEAAQEIAEIVGDSEITHGGAPAGTPAAGLHLQVEEQSTEIHNILVTVLSSGGYPDAEQRKNLESSSLKITKQVIDALREVDNYGIYSRRLAAEIALSRVIDLALLARRVLITGQSEPNIAAAGPANETIDKAVERLEEEIDRLVFEYRVRRSLVSGTAIELLNADRRAGTPSSIPQQIVNSRPPW